MPSVEKKLFGTLSDGADVELVTLENEQGNKISICLFGLNVTDLIIKDKHSNPVNVVLGCQTLQEFVDQEISLNSIVGRVAGGISNGILPVEDNVYQLPCNDGDHHLHGGHAFSKLLWQLENLTLVDNIPTLITSADFPDEHQGYPGNLHCQITIQFLNNNTVRFSIKGNTDKSTHLNVTHHAYFNLSGKVNEPVASHLFKFYSSEITELNQEMIPTGKIISITDTVMDFNKPKNLNGLLDSDDFYIRQYGGFDHNYVIKHQKNEKLLPCAQVACLETGIQLTVKSTMPGVQFFTGQVLDGIPNRDGGVYKNHTAFCLEPQYFPDTPNRPEFPSTLVTAESDYHEVIEWAFETE